MAITVETAFIIGDIGLTGGRVYRVGDNGVVIHANRIASFDDDGVVFSVIEYEPAPGGFGDVDPYFVHDNGDGTMNVYFRLTMPGLPLTHNDVYVTLNAETGAKIGPTHDLPFSQFGDLGAMGHTNAAGKAFGQMLQQAISLSDGTIAIVDTSIALNQAVFKIVNADGTSVSLSAAFTSSNASHNSQLLFDLTEVGDKIAVVWTNNNPGDIGAPLHLQLFNKDGSLSGGEINLGNSSSTPFGNTPAAQAETLSDGRILVVWVENGTSSGPDQDQTSTWFSIRNADGTESVGATMVNTEVTKARQDTPTVIVTENGFVIGYSVLDFAGIQEGRLKEYDANGTLLDTETGAYIWGSDDIVRTDNNTAFVVGGNIYEITLPGADTALDAGGGTGGQTLTGTTGRDVLDGGAGDDTLTGKGGNDMLSGGGGDDDLFGNKGNDRLNGNDGADTLKGGGGKDRLFGDNGNDMLFGGAGNDRLSGGGGNDMLLGGAGNDRLSGGGGNDKLFGGAGIDTMFGGKGNDRLVGNKGADILDGGAGRDILIGGGGQDNFVFKTGYGKDRIKDFRDNVDTIQLDAGLWSGTLTNQQVIDQFATVVNATDILFVFGTDELRLTGFSDLGALADDLVII